MTGHAGAVVRHVMVVASVLPLLLVILAPSARAGWEEGYSKSEIIDMARKWAERVDELEREIDTLEGQSDVVHAALESGLVSEEDRKFYEWNLRGVRAGLERMRKDLRQARLFRDIFEAAKDDPAIVRQLEKTLRAKHELVSILLEIYDWYPPDVWVPKQDLFPGQREETLQRARKAREEFDRQNEALGQMYRAAFGGTGGGSGQGESSEGSGGCH